jgi:hypothetical protein
MAKKKRHSRVKIATKLAQANDLTTQGKLQSESARTLGVSVMTLRRWRKADEGRGVPRFSARRASHYSFRPPSRGPRARFTIVQNAQGDDTGLATTGDPGECRCNRC